MMDARPYVDAVLAQLSAPTAEQQQQLLPLLNEAGNGLAAAVVTFPVGRPSLGRAAGLSVELVGRPFLVDGMYRRQSKFPVDLSIVLQPVSSTITDDVEQQVWGQPFDLDTVDRMRIVSALADLAIVRIGVTSVMHNTDEVSLRNDDGTYSHAERAVHLMFGVSVCRAGVILTKPVIVGRGLNSDGTPAHGFDLVTGGGDSTPVSRHDVVAEVKARVLDAFGHTLLGMCVRDKVGDILTRELARNIHAEIAHMAHTDISAKGALQSQLKRVQGKWSAVFGRWPAIILEVTHRPKPAVKAKRAIELE